MYRLYLMITDGTGKFGPVHVYCVVLIMGTGINTFRLLNDVVKMQALVL